MVNQASLFDAARGRTRRGDPATARHAAAKIRDTGAPAAILAAISDAGPAGLTDDELCAAIPDRHGPTIKSARSRLTNAGWLVPTGEERLSVCGEPMTAWTISPKKGIT